MNSRPSFEGRFLPHCVMQGWLGDADAGRLLDHILSVEAQFKPSRVAEGLDTETRRSLVLRGLGPFGSLLADRARAVQWGLEAAFGMGHVAPGEVESEIVAHGDGGFYGPHIDTLTGEDHVAGQRRRLTLVYYVHRRPRGFSGGRLRLHDMAGRRTVDIAPDFDSLVAFPSFARHEVERVSCPGNAFADSRFSVNLWLCG
jgi:SM-20-related protein